VGHELQQVSPGSVALASLLAGLAACGLLAALERTAPRPRATWIVIACAVVALSLAGPISLGQTNDAIAVLTSMHLAAAGVLIPTLARLTPRMRRLTAAA
jgi:4-amino-4-deoxy-L-arabinose transferase-like glycosyltransferase